MIDRMILSKNLLYFKVLSIHTKVHSNIIVHLLIFFFFFCWKIMFDMDPFENIQLHSVEKLHINKLDSSNQTNAIFFWYEFQNIIFLDNETANCDIGFPSMY